MKVVFNLNNYYKEKKPVALALGTFDGIHKGHRQLLKELDNYKSSYNFIPAVYTFIRHPLYNISPLEVPPQIMTLKEKMSTMSRLNVDLLILNSFNDQFMHLSPEEFINSLTSCINLKAVVVGYNYRFGFKGRGDITMLKAFAEKYGFQLTIVDPIYKNGDIVSSSRIRNLISNGNMPEAASLLDMPYMIKGNVVHGYQRGRKLGFPTANINPPPNKVLPKSGVYLALCCFEGCSYWGITNVGHNPTFSPCNRISIETYLFDFKGSLYNKAISILFIKRLRDEKKFDSPVELSSCIREDIKKAKNFIYNIL